MTSSSSSIRPPTGNDIAVLALCAILLASSFGAITLALDQLSALQVAAARCTVAAVALWLWSALSRRSSPKAPDLWPYALVVGTLGYALPFALLAWAETSLAPGHTAMLFCSGPVFAVVIAWLWQKDEKSSPWIFLGMALCTAGIVILSRSGGSIDQAPSLPASLAVLACALCYALSGIWARKAPASSDLLTRRSLCFASLLLLVSCAFEGQALPILAPRTMLSAVYLGLVPTALCSVLRYRQIRSLGYTFVSQTGYLVPTFGAVLGFLFFAEPISSLQMAGLALCLGGLWWSRRCMSRYSKNAAIRSSGRGGAD